MTVSRRDHLPEVLVVDDEPEVLRTLEDLLRKEFQVHATSDPDAALQLLATHPIAAVITDQRMPKVSGTELLARAVKLRPDTVRILLTGYSDIDATIRAVNDGRVFHYLTKPWAADELLELLRESTRHFALREENHRLVAEMALLHGEIARRAPAGPSDPPSLSEEVATLRAALEDLQNSWWHLRKMGEVLPFCMECNKVKSAGAAWEDLAKYFRLNTAFLSHGYCPECAAKLEDASSP
jgi:response regulator RpfG family c-di-GMP phosphodiesterase